MTAHPRGLPQLGPDLFVTDGGIETTLVDLEGVALPGFAAFVLLDDTGAGAVSLRDYYRSYGQLSCCLATGIILDTPTWRANPDWGAALGYHAHELHDVNRRAVELLAEVRCDYQMSSNPVIISGCVGPRRARYTAGAAMRVEDAAEYHDPQVTSLAAAGVDVVTATAMTNVAEAAGIVVAAAHAGVPSAVGLTVEADCCLPDGTPLADAVTMIDALTAAAPAYYLVSCAHPSHFTDQLSVDRPWSRRIRGARANASRDRRADVTCTARGCGDDPDEPADLAGWMVSLHRRLDHFTVLGGCCGTDERHIEEMVVAARGGRAGHEP